jgi:GNAT superfamily N-acetyltransferase
VWRLPAGEVDRVEHLWRAMVSHHRDVAAGWPVRDAADSWRRRRAEYAGWLERERGWLLAAMPAGGDVPDGYAMVTVHAPGPTFALGEEVGDLESLAVAPEARGAGVGTLLLAEARQLLRSRGVRHWTVSAVDGNVDALRLYSREGFRPFYRTLMAPLD